MDHKERVNIAKELCRKIMAGHKVYYVGIYGSTARGEDTRFSDLEMVIVTKDKHWWGVFRINGLSVWLHLEPLSKVYEQIPRVDPEGDSNTNNYLNSMTLYDRIGLKKEIRKRLRKVEYAAFKDAALVPLGEVNDHVSKMRNAIEVHKRKDALVLERFILLSQADRVVALINRKHFTRGGKGHLKDISRFKYVPNGYLRLSNSIWTARDGRKALSAAIKLSDSLTAFAKAHGIEIASYPSASRWPGLEG